MVGPTTVLDFLGIILDTDTMEIRLSEETGTRAVRPAAECLGTCQAMGVMWDCLLRESRVSYLVN